MKMCFLEYLIFLHILNISISIILTFVDQSKYGLILIFQANQIQIALYYYFFI